jgi:hypothetical protein
VILAAAWHVDAAAQRLDEALLADLEYREIGPTRQSGRFVDIAVPERRPYTTLEGSSDAGLHGVRWDMTRRIERSAAEQERMRNELERERDANEDVDPEEEEDRIRFEESDAPPGEYRVLLSVGGRDLEETVTILRDDWWMERR